jgi:hypothetical protein
LSSYVASNHLAVAPQSGAKDQFYCTVLLHSFKLKFVKIKEYLRNEKNVEDSGVSQI